MTDTDLASTNAVSAFPKGSEWRRWDLQTATILDDGYVPLAQYSNTLKQENLADWQEYVAMVGGEANALLYDSAAYFTDASIDKKLRCTNYVRNLFAFIDVFRPALRVWASPTITISTTTFSTPSSSTPNSRDAK